MWSYENREGDNLIIILLKRSDSTRDLKWSHALPRCSSVSQLLHLYHFCISGIGYFSQICSCSSLSQGPASVYSWLFLQCSKCAMTRLSVGLFKRGNSFYNLYLKSLVWAQKSNLHYLVVFWSFSHSRLFFYNIQNVLALRIGDSLCVHKYVCVCVCVCVWESEWEWESPDRWTGAGASVSIDIYFYLRKVEPVSVGEAAEQQAAFGLQWTAGRRPHVSLWEKPTHSVTVERFPLHRVQLDGGGAWKNYVKQLNSNWTDYIYIYIYTF